MRYEAVRSFAIKGDRPSIDTIEAGIQVLNIRLSLSQAEMELVKAGNALDGQIWDNNRQNIRIANRMQPLEISTAV